MEKTAAVLEEILQNNRGNVPAHLGFASDSRRRQSPAGRRGDGRGWVDGPDGLRVFDVMEALRTVLWLKSCLGCVGHFFFLGENC